MSVALADRKFTGYAREDAIGGIDFAQARYYDSVIGRFLSADVDYDGGLADPQGLNRYSYVKGHAMNAIDPTGKQCFLSFLCPPPTVVMDTNVTPAVNVQDSVKATLEAQPTATGTPSSPTSPASAATPQPSATAKPQATSTPDTFWEAMSIDPANDAPAHQGTDLAQMAQGINMGGLTRWTTVGVARIDGDLHLAISIRFAPSTDALQNIYAQAKKAGIDIGNIHIDVRYAELQLADIGNQPGRIFNGLIGIGNPKGPCSACRAEIFTSGKWQVRPRVIYPKKDNDRGN